MKARTQLLLYRMLWLGERILQPTVRNAFTSFEEWSSRGGLWRDIHRLEEKAYLEASGAACHMDRAIKLTEKGRIAALGGCVPTDHWDRPWDGKWRILLFDIPESSRPHRDKMRAMLRSARFGNLQRSVWLSPDSLDGIADEIRTLGADCQVLTGFAGTPCLGEKNTEIVAAAWDFQKATAVYQTWRAHVDHLGNGDIHPGGVRFPAWADRENALWADCIAKDPLLPRELWPLDYPGEISWNHRMKLLNLAPLSRSPDLIQ